MVQQSHRKLGFTWDVPSSRNGYEITGFQFDIVTLDGERVLQELHPTRPEVEVDERTVTSAAGGIVVRVAGKNRFIRGAYTTLEFGWLLVCDCASVLMRSV